MILPSPDSDAPKIAIILHQERSSPGRVGQKLVERGFALDIFRPVLGDVLPCTIDEYAGVVVFGGPGSANDNEDYVRTETDWLAKPLEANKPLFAICLGAQMLANHLGGKVYGRSDGKVEIGYYPLIDEDRQKRFAPWPDTVYHFHREGFVAPSNAQILASSELYPHQAFCMDDKTVAIQFHVELTLEMMCRWTIKGEHRFSLPNSQKGPEHLRGRLIHDHKSIKWLDRFLDKWIGHSKHHMSE